jgi:hypothetical protein
MVEATLYELFLKPGRHCKVFQTKQLFKQNTLPFRPLKKREENLKKSKGHTVQMPRRTIEERARQLPADFEAQDN